MIDISHNHMNRNVKQVSFSAFNCHLYSEEYIDVHGKKELGQIPN